MIPGGLVVEIRKRPLETFFEWFRSLGPNLGDEFTGRLTSLAPDRLLEGRAMSVHEEVGTVVMLAALVDFVFRGRMTAEEWDALGEIEVQMTAGEESEPLGSSLRAKQWIRAFASWDALRRTTLSVDAIEDYLDQHHSL